MTTCGTLLSAEEVREFVRKERLQRFDYIPVKPVVGGQDDDDFGELGTLDWLAARSDAAASAFDVGNKIILPDSVPVTFPPYGGARRGRAWHSRTRLTVGRVKRKVQDKNGKPVVCATYLNHGRTGMKFGIDILFSRFTQKCNQAEENAGDRLSEWAVRHWGKLNINYIIWWNWMNDGAGWFDYEPLRRKWDFGAPNLVASRHLDHVHLQINSPFIRGNE
jgi:hypothetical protein